MSQGAGAASAIKRIQRELKEISETPSKFWSAAPVADDLFEWQFVVRGPPSTDFEGGIYTGRIVLPVNYPLAPPSLMLLTPNGRWEVGKKICLSNTSYHPELWQPAWGIRTMIEALRSHFNVPGDGAIGAIDWPSELRRRLAKESLDFVTPPGTEPNRTLLAELSPEELKEEGPVSLPEGLMPLAEVSAPPSEAQVEPAFGAPAADSGLVLAASEQPTASEPPAASSISSAVVPGAQGVAPAAVPAVTEADVTSTSDADGLRQRKEPPSDKAVPPAATATAGNTTLPVVRRRSREDGMRPQRRPPRRVLVQLLKPPQTGRGWVLFAISVMIFLLTVSFLMVLADLIRNPPELLEALPGPKKPQD